MKKIFIRLTALLLIPLLVSAPSTAIGFSVINQFPQVEIFACNPTPINEEALMLPGIWALHSDSSRAPTERRAAGTAGQISQTRHSYQLVSDEDRLSLDHAIVSEFRENRIAYLRRFAGRNAQEELDRQLSLPDQPEDRVEDRIANQVFLRDEEDGLWILKMDRPGRDDKKRDMLAYLLAKGRANVAEVRFITTAEAEGLPESLKSNLEGCYLRRLVTESNMHHTSLPQTDVGQAYSAILVANVLIRNLDPHWANVGYAGAIPVTFDKTWAFGDLLPFEVPLRDNSAAYLYMHIWHTLMLFLSREVGIPSIFENLGHPNNRFRHAVENLRQISPDGNFEPHHRFFREWMRDYLGLGHALAAAEQWDPDQLRQSIVAFKSISPNEIRAMAEQAGYQEGEELDNIVSFLVENQKTLGRDVGRVVDSLTDMPDDFAVLDSLRKQQTLERLAVSVEAGLHTDTSGVNAHAGLSDEGLERIAVILNRHHLQSGVDRLEVLRRLRTNPETSSQLIPYLMDTHVQERAVAAAAQGADILIGSGWTEELANRLRHEHPDAVIIAEVPYHETVDQTQQTLEDALAVKPDGIILKGYAKWAAHAEGPLAFSTIRGNNPELVIMVAGGIVTRKEKERQGKDFLVPVSDVLNRPERLIPCVGFARTTEEDATAFAHEYEEEINETRQVTPRRQRRKHTINTGA